MKTHYFAALLLVICVTAQADEVPDPSYGNFSKALPCVNRIGRCFDATIAGIKVTVIKEKTRQESLLRDAKTKNNRVRTLYWELTQEVDGNKVLDITTMPNAFGLASVGEQQDSPDITITPLQEQTLASKATVSEANNVNIGGQSAVTQQETLQQNYLPPGEYVLSIRYNGKENWDRKEVLVKVKAFEQKEVVQKVAAETTTVSSSMQAGAWELQTTVTALNVKTGESKAFGDTSTKVCFTQSFLDKEPFLTPGIDKEKMEKKNAKCTISEEKRSANASSWKMSCSMQDGSIVLSNISNRISKNRLQSTVQTATATTSSDVPVVFIKTAGSFVGACAPTMPVQ
jgi:Protein of unknown function (DUF3617)